MTKRFKLPLIALLVFSLVAMPFMPVMPAAAEDSVPAVNTPPEIVAIDDQTLEWDNPIIDISPIVIDPDEGDVPTLTLEGTLPNGVNYEPELNLISGIPTAEGIGSFPVTLTATDSAGATYQESFTITVEKRTPILTAFSAPASAENGTEVTASVRMLYTEGGQGLPGQTINFIIGSQSQPTSTDYSGTALTTITLDQPEMNTNVVAEYAGNWYFKPVSKSSQFVIGYVNYPPVLAAIPDQTVEWGHAMTPIIPSVTDTNAGDVHTFQLTGTLPDGVTYDLAANTLQGTPTQSAVGSYPLTVTATDGGGASDQKSFTLTVDKRSTSLTIFDSPSMASNLTPVAMQARLTDSASGTPIVGASVDFTISSQSQTGITDSAGEASATITLDQADQTTTANANFAGNDAYKPTADADPFTIAAGSSFFGITPGTAVVQTGGIRQFTASGNAEWSILAEPGVASGTISPTGLYTAPLNVPEKGKVTIQARSTDSSKYAAAILYITSATADGTFGVGSTTVMDGDSRLLDLDNDGIVDLLCANSSGYEHYWRKGTSAGTFGDKQPLTRSVVYLPLGYEGIYAEDLNRDGFKDLIGTRDTGFTVHFGNGDGTFTYGYERNWSVWLRDAAFADFDNDGDLDMAVVGNNSYIQICTNDGTGQLFGGPSALVGQNGSQVECGDINRDGRMDLVATATDPATGNLKIYTALQEATGSYTVRELDMGFAAGAYGLYVVDLNEDGKLDVIVHSSGYYLKEYMGSGDGTYTEYPMALTDGNEFVLGQFNADKHWDLVVSTSSGLVLKAGNGTGAFGSDTLITTQRPSFLALKTMSMNGDAQYDLAFSFYNGTNSVMAVLLGGPGVGQPPTLTLTPAAANVNAGLDLQFTTKLAGTLDTSVLWYVNGIQGGNSSVGTISSGLYTAPDTIPAAEVVVEARLASDPNVKDSATLNFTDYRWTSKSAGLSGLDVRELTYSCDGQNLYAGTNTGVYRQLPSGAWQDISGPMAGQTVWVITADPVNPMILYAGVYGTAGLFKTTDGGNTWIPKSYTSYGYQTINSEVTNILVDPVNPNIILAATLRGLYRSIDGAETWVYVDPNYITYGFDVMMTAPGQPGTYYLVKTDKILKSSDQGITWVDSMILTENKVTNLWIDPNNGQHWIVRTWEPERVKESWDGGLTWVDITIQDWTVPYTGSIGSVTFSRTVPGLVIAASGDSVYLSQSADALNFYDIGRGLTSESGWVGAYASAIAPVANSQAGTFVVGTNRGIYVTTTVEAAPALMITPTTAVVQTGNTIQLTATGSVEWSVVTEPGVDSGSINAAGLYTAPVTVPEKGKVTVLARSTESGAYTSAVLNISSGTADGTFNVASTTVVDISTWLLDLDNDGITDFLGAQSGGFEHYWRKGASDGSFGDKRPLNRATVYLPLGYDGIYAEDLNHDGYKDLIGIRDTGYVVNFGYGDGTFYPGYERNWSTWLRDAAFADFDNDGDLDMAAVGGSYVQVCLNDGTGQLFGGPSVSVGQNSSQVAAGDINKDGRLDLVAVGTDPASGNLKMVTALKGDTGSYTSTEMNIGFSGWAYALYLVDLNEDGKLDVLLETSGYPLKEYMGNGDGTFTEFPMVLTNGNEFVLGQFNADKHWDLAVSTTAGLALKAGDGTGAFGSDVLIAAKRPSSSTLRTMSMNGDAQYDLAFCFNDGSQSMWAVLLGGPGAGQTPVLTLVPEKATLNTGKSLQFAAKTAGTLDTAVLWYVNGIQGGSSSVGTISSGLYTAPAEIPAVGSVTIEARLAADANVKDSAVLNFTDYRWTNKSVGLMGLDVRALTYSCDGQTLYAGTNTGVYRQLSDGSWQNISGPMAEKTVWVITADPANPMVLYAGVYGTAGVFKTMDGGNTWVPKSYTSDGYQTINSEVTNILVDSLNPNIVVAATLRGLYRSVNGGEAWVYVNPNYIIYGFDVLMAAPGSPGTDYLVMSNKIYISRDWGLTWIESGILPGMNVTSLWIDPNNGQHMIARTWDPEGVKESHNGGITWTDITIQDWAVPYTGSIGGVAFNRTVPGLVAAASGSSVYLSTSASNLDLHDIGRGVASQSGQVGVYALEIAPAGNSKAGQFFAGTNYGVYTTAQFASNPISSLLNNGPVVEGSAAQVYFGTVTDVDSVSFTYSFDWNNDGVYEIVDQAANNADHTWYDNGTYTVKGMVKDEEGNYSQYTTDVVVNNAPPTSSMTNNGPAQEAMPVTVTFGPVNDPGQSDTFTYSFDWDNDGIYDVIDQAEGSADRAWNQQGTYTVKGRVKDDDGGFSEYTTDVVVNNAAPTSSLTNSGPIDEGSPATISFGPVNDSGPDNMFTYSFDWNNDGTYDIAGQEANSAAHIWSDNGAYTVRAKVTDSQGAYSEYTTEVVVNNAAPQGELNNNGPAPEGSPVNVGFPGVFDPGVNDTLTYSFDWDNDGTYDIINQVANNADHIWNSQGTYLVKGRVMDDDGGFNEYITEVVVTNAAPTSSLTNNGPAAEGSPVTVSFGPVNDGGQDNSFGYSFDWNNDGTYELVGQEANSVEHIWSDNGTYTVRGRVTDNQGAYSEYTTEVVVENAVPQGELNNYGPAPEGSPVNVSFAEVFDPGVNDILSYSFDWNNDGIYDIVGQAAMSAEHIWPDNGTYTVRGRVTDNQGAYSEYTTEVVVNNVAPQSEFNNNGPAAVGSPIRVSFAGFYDPGVNDTITYSFDWDNDGNYDIVDQADNNAEHIWYAAGTYVVRGRVMDNDGGSNEYLTEVVVTAAADSTPPVIDPHQDVMAEATGLDGAVVTFTAPNAVDELDGSFAATCTPPSGSQFALGSTTVTCTAQDTAGHQAEATSFQVIVRDTTAPAITAPADKTVILTGRTTKVNLGQPVVSDIFPVVISNDAPAAFPVGTTTVIWTARDANGNVNTAVQKVTVKYGSFRILPPLSTRNTTTFRKGSVIPVMFELRNAQNRKVSYARATLSYARMTGGAAGPEMNAVSIIPRQDSSFKYVFDQYLFTMSTARMPAGQYRLSIKLDDGSTYYVYINLK